MIAEAHVPGRVLGAIGALTPPATKKLGIAVSGGSDSMSLLACAALWAEQSGARLFAATVDHGLRPEAAGEARFVAAACSNLGVAHETLLWRPAAGSVSQAMARQARHALLARWAHASGISQVLIGHTEDDRFETFILRARAGSRWYGLPSPLPSSASPAWPFQDRVRLLRPMLGVRRAALRKWLSEEAGWTWIEDPTNLRIRHERVRVRALLRRLEPETARLRGIIRRLAVMRSGVMARAGRALDDARDRDGRILIGSSELAALDAEARLRLLEGLIGAVAQRRAPPDRRALERLSAGLISGAPGRSLGGLLFRIRGHHVEVRPETGRSAIDPASTEGILARARALLSDPLPEAVYPAAEGTAEQDF